MSSTKIITIVVGVFFALLIFFESVFTVDQTERAIILTMGKPEPGVLEPGLHFKLPFVQEAILLDARILHHEARSAEILTKDKKNMVVDNFSKWRINNQLLFYQAVKNVHNARSQLDAIIYSSLREALGNYTLMEIVSGKRGKIMDEVTNRVNVKLKELGISVVDVRIRRTDLPAENEQAIYKRMSAERARQAKLYRSEGREEGAKIRSLAEKEKTIILADAQKEANLLKGQGDAEAAKIFTESLQMAPEFYSFLRSMEAYRKSLSTKTSFILTPQSRFLKYFK